MAKDSGVFHAKNYLRWKAVEPSLCAFSALVCCLFQNCEGTVKANLMAWEVPNLRWFILVQSTSQAKAKISQDAVRQVLH